MKLLKVLASKEMEKDADGFIKKCKDVGLDKIDIKNKLDAEKGLDKIIQALS